MKKLYEKPIIYTVILKTEEITASQLLSSTYIIHASESTNKSWTTISY